MPKVSNDVKASNKSTFISSHKIMDKTSTSATNEAAIIAKASPASNVGAPH